MEVVHGTDTVKVLRLLAGWRTDYGPHCAGDHRSPVRAAGYQPGTGCSGAQGTCVPSNQPAGTTPCGDRSDWQGDHPNGGDPPNAQ